MKVCRCLIAAVREARLWSTFLTARLQREQDPKSSFVFTSERGAPFSSAGFARMIERAGIEAKFGFKPHSHMLRHACGYALANRGHDTRALQAYRSRRRSSSHCELPKIKMQWKEPPPRSLEDLRSSKSLSP